MLMLLITNQALVTHVGVFPLLQLTRHERALGHASKGGRILFIVR